MTTSANSEQELREKISTLLESLIGKTWVELLENAPEVMFAQHDIDIHADLLITLIKEAGWVKLEKPNPEDTIEDGFGSMWSAFCPTCKQKSMVVVRPGKVQCNNCE